MCARTSKFGMVLFGQATSSPDFILILIEIHMDL